MMAIIFFTPFDACFHFLHIIFATSPLMPVISSSPFRYYYFFFIDITPLSLPELFRRLSSLLLRFIILSLSFDIYFHYAVIIAIIILIDISLSIIIDTLSFIFMPVIFLLFAFLSFIYYLFLSFI